MSATEQITRMGRMTGRASSSKELPLDLDEKNKRGEQRRGTSIKPAMRVESKDKKNSALPVHSLSSVEMVHCSLDPENPTKPHKSRGSILCVPKRCHFAVSMDAIPAVQWQS